MVDNATKMRKNISTIFRYGLQHTYLFVRFFNFTFFYCSSFLHALEDLSITYALLLKCSVVRDEVEKVFFSFFKNCWYLIVHYHISRLKQIVTRHLWVWQARTRTLDLHLNNSVDENIKIKQKYASMFLEIFSKIQSHFWNSSTKNE